MHPSCQKQIVFQPLREYLASLSCKILIEWDSQTERPGWKGTECNESICASVLHQTFIRNLNRVKEDAGGGVPVDVKRLSEINFIKTRAVYGNLIEPALNFLFPAFPLRCYQTLKHETQMSKTHITQILSSPSSGGWILALMLHFRDANSSQLAH